MASRLPVVSAMVCMSGTSRSIDLDDTDEEVDTELPSLLNLWMGEGDGDRGGAADRSCCIWPWLQPLSGTYPWSWWEFWEVYLGSPMYSSVLGSLSSCGDPSWSQKLNGRNASRWVQGCLGPPASAHHYLWYHLPAFTQTQCTGTELSLLANPTNTSW